MNFEKLKIDEKKDVIEVIKLIIEEINKLRERIELLEKTWWM